MTWRTFAGELSEVYFGLLKYRCVEDGVELTRENLSEQLHLHIHRGIGYLVGNPIDVCAAKQTLRPQRAQRAVLVSPDSQRAGLGACPP